MTNEEQYKRPEFLTAGLRISTVMMVLIAGLFACLGVSRIAYIIEKQVKVTQEHRYKQSLKDRCSNIGCQTIKSTCVCGVD